MEMNDNHVEYHTVKEFMTFCVGGPEAEGAGTWTSTFPGKYLEGGKEAGGQLVDQRLLPRIDEGEVRILMAGDTCQMAIHKKPMGGGLSAVGGNSEYTYYKPTDAKYKGLIEKLYADIPTLLPSLGLAGEPLPLLWTCDYIPKNPDDWETRPSRADDRSAADDEDRVHGRRVQLLVRRHLQVPGGVCAARRRSPTFSHSAASKFSNCQNLTLSSSRSRASQENRSRWVAVVQLRRPLRLVLRSPSQSRPRSPRPRRPAPAAAAPAAADPPPPEPEPVAEPPPPEPEPEPVAEAPPPEPAPEPAAEAPAEEAAPRRRSEVKCDHGRENWMRPRRMGAGGGRRGQGAVHKIDVRVAAQDVIGACSVSRERLVL